MVGSDFYMYIYSILKGLEAIGLNEWRVRNAWGIITEL